MSLTYPEDNLDDSWHWLVIHRDDWQVPEFCEESGQHHNFAVAITEAPVQAIALIPQRADLQPVVLLVPADARPIVFRSRNTFLIFDPDGPVNDPPRITGIGWQKTIDGRNEQTLLALYDDGSMVLTDDRQRV